MTLEEAKSVKVGDKVIARVGALSLRVECKVIDIIEGIERIKFCLAYQHEDGKMEHITRTHMRCWKIRGILEQDKNVKPISEWIYDHDLAGMHYYRCPICTNAGVETFACETEARWWRFCPRCGSKMFTKEEK